ncbi:hypothetical protein LCGC14_2892870 [marine sediment metagenome]|uniref:Uncharacterized protein n=1 Tax=marine sediment metagenome TaxID=412755 RepID=A0A0F8XWP9_9ZZZZ
MSPDSEVERACRICGKVKKWKWAGDWQTNNGMCSDECKDNYREREKCPMAAQSFSDIEYACTINSYSCFATEFKECSELIKHQLYMEYLEKKKNES